MSIFRLARAAAQRSHAPEPELSLGRAVLTPRERAVCALVAEGLDTKEIAGEMGLTYQTIKTYLHRAKSKLGLRNRTEIAILWHGGTPRSLQAG